MIKRFVFGSVLLSVLMTIQACAPPPRDARAISESEFKGDIKSDTTSPAAGGGKSLKKNEW